MGVLRQANESGTAVVLITHDMDEALQADRIVVVDGGQIAMEGTPREVFSRENAPRLQRLGIELPVAARYAFEHGIEGELPLTLDDLVKAVREQRCIHSQVMSC